MIRLDAVEIDALAQSIAEAVDGTVGINWEKASMEYRAEFTDGALAAIAYLNALNGD